MPAFSFEKILPPVPHAPAAATSVVRKQPGIIIQMLDRFVEARVKRAGAEKSKSAPKPD
jgi:hypothetical protein